MFTILTNLWCIGRLGGYRGDERLQEDERMHYCHRHVEFAVR